MAVWFDVDDLVRYFCYNARPTGIQRLSLLLFRELSARAAAGEAIYFCRRQPQPPYFYRIDFPALDRILRILIDEPPALSAQATTSRNKTRPKWLRNLPPRQLISLSRIAKASREIVRAMRDFFTVTHETGLITGVSQFDLPSKVVFASGDWLVNLGSSWNAPYCDEALNYLKHAGGYFAIMVHDLIPAMFPEWSARETLQEFRLWIRQTIPAVDLALVYSRNTQADLRHHLSSQGVSGPVIRTLPMGAPPPADQSRWQAAQGRPFVLLVSTLEVRKNHLLMFRVWQTLLERYPAAQVPDLVFAGKRGWLTNDFLCQLENADWLNGKIRFVENPADAELTMLYQQCLFTVYPSFYEGWGLPVSESLSFGKTVAASDRASIPEAGGDFCVYFDPENLAQASDVIGGLIRHPERVAALERQIAQHYHPPGWSETAGALLECLAAFNVPVISLIHQAA